MEKTTWLRRQHAAMTAAHLAKTARSRVIHCEIAGRYGFCVAGAPELGTTAAEASWGGGR